MDQVHARVSRALSALDYATRARRLANIVCVLAREVERLDEDNSQLRAAVSIYRDVVRRSAKKPK